MKTLHIFSFISIISYISSMQADTHFIDQMFNEVRIQMEETHKTMENMWSNYAKTMDEAWSQIPTTLSKTSTTPSIDINYNDSSNIIVSITFAKNSLKEADAQAHEKRDILSVTIKQESGDTVLNVDRRGLQITNEQHVEVKTKDDDEKESSHVSYSSQSHYQAFQAPIEAAKAKIDIKEDTLIITLPREEKIKKVHINRQEKEKEAVITEPITLNIKE